MRLTPTNWSAPVASHLRTWSIKKTRGRRVLSAVLLEPISQTNPQFQTQCFEAVARGSLFWRASSGRDGRVLSSAFDAPRPTLRPWVRQRGLMASLCCVHPHQHLLLLRTRKRRRAHPARLHSGIFGRLLRAHSPRNARPRGPCARRLERNMRRPSLSAPRTASVAVDSAAAFPLPRLAQTLPPHRTAPPLLPRALLTPPPPPPPPLLLLARPPVPRRRHPPRAPPLRPRTRQWSRQRPPAGVAKQGAGQARTSPRRPSARRPLPRPCRRRRRRAESHPGGEGRRARLARAHARRGPRRAGGCTSGGGGEGDGDAGAGWAAGRRLALAPPPPPVALALGRARGRRQL